MGPEEPSSLWGGSLAIRCRRLTLCSWPAKLALLRLCWQCIHPATPYSLPACPPAPSFFRSRLACPSPPPRSIFFVSGINTLIQTTIGDRLPIVQVGVGWRGVGWDGGWGLRQSGSRGCLCGIRMSLAGQLPHTHWYVATTCTCPAVSQLLAPALLSSTAPQSLVPSQMAPTSLPPSPPFPLPPPPGRFLLLPQARLLHHRHRQGHHDLRHGARQVPGRRGDGGPALHAGCGLRPWCNKAMRVARTARRGRARGA